MCSDCKKKDSKKISWFIFINICKTNIHQIYSLIQVVDTDDGKHKDSKRVHVLNVYAKHVFLSNMGCILIVVVDTYDKGRQQSNMSLSLVNQNS